MMRKNLLIKTSAYLTLCLMAFLGNKYSIPLFFGVDLIFGSIFVFIVMGVFGFLAAIPVALIASGYTYILWSHPYAIIIFLSEFLFISFIHKHSGKNLVFWDVVFWIIIGIPLIFVFYKLVMDLPDQSVVLIMLKQSINGIFNMLLAFIVLSFLPSVLLRSRKNDFSTISFRTIIFTIILLSLSVPSLVIIVFLAKNEFKKIEKDIIQELNSSVVEVNGSIGDWLGQKIFVVSRLSEKLNNHEIEPSPFIQTSLELIISVNPDLHNMYVANKEGITRAFYPPFNIKGESTIGIDFSDRDYFKLLKSGSERVISDVFQGRGGVFLPIITISAPIYDQKHFSGFVLAALKTDHIKSIIKRIADNRSGSVTIIDSKRHVIASTMSNRPVLSSYNIKTSWDTIKVGNNTYQGFRKQDAQLSGMKKWNNSVFIRTSLAPFNKDWTIIAEIPSHEYIVELNRFYVSSLLFLFILSTGSIVLSSFISFTMVRPLLQLQNTATALSNRIEEGKTMNKWEKSKVSKSSLEVAQLGHAFNLMLTKLENAQNQLIDAKELAESQAQLAEKMALFAQAFPFPILSINSEGKIETANTAADSAFRVAVKGCDFNDLFPNMTNKFLDEIKQGGEIFYLNISIGSRYFLFTLQLVKQYNVIHAFGTDITKLRQVEEKAHEKQLWEALYLRAGEILHEVGNKLLILVGYLDEIKYIKNELKKADEKEDMIQIKKWVSSLDPEIGKALETLNVIQEIVDRMSLRKRKIVEKNEINIFNLVSHSIEDEKYKVPSVVFFLKCPEELKQTTCLVDEIHIGQILTNLLKNAEYAIRIEENQLITIEFSSNQNFLIIDIIDNGTGIPKKIQSKIFEDNFSTKVDEGKGIGLALCQSLTNENNGSLTLLWSEENGGSAFRLTLKIENIHG